MLKKIKLIISTVRFLKIEQFIGQFKFRLKSKRSILPIHADKLCLNREIGFNICVFSSEKMYYYKNGFEFLNLRIVFDNEIDWNFNEYGKLWTYNFEYFNFLNQNDISKDEKNRLIENFYSFSSQKKRVLEAYPISLRAINIIKYVIRERIYSEEYIHYVYQELSFLHKNYEYHLLGNHLLENAFAMCLGGVFFKNNIWRDKAIKILSEELKEQILEDGAHFELSPMYHNIIFFRLLELIDWYGEYDQREEDFLAVCHQKASLMLDWLENIKFDNGDIPLFNDAANGIAYEASFLLDYAKQLGIERADVPLGDSGYRSFGNELYEIKMDLAQIGASYQPGHAHADALSFILYNHNVPLFVEQGTSTYQIGERRNLERSTEAHNTVVVNGVNQSEVWDGFRVGKRAVTTIYEETSNTYEASHDGYKKYGIIHKRKFILDKKKMKVLDRLSQKGDAMFYLHIHPNRTLSKINESQFAIDNNIVISIEGATAICIG